jgi:hypothetical protein
MKREGRPSEGSDGVDDDDHEHGHGQDHGGDGTKSNKKLKCAASKCETTKTPTPTSTKKNVNNTNKKTKRSLPSPSSNSSSFSSSSCDVDIFKNGDIAPVVFSFLAARDLYRFATCSKSFMTRLTHKDVVRSAIYNGGHAKSSLERIIPLIKARSIWTPSPVRLLRVVNGRRCEHCLLGRANMINKNYGVFFCWDCITGKGFTKSVSHNKKWSPFLSHKRVAQGCFSSKSYLWMKPVKDAAGSKIGPLVHMHIMEQIRNTNSTVDKYLETIDPIDPQAKNAEVIVQEYDQCVDDAEQRLKEMTDQKMKATKEANDIRKAKSEDIVSTVSNLLGDVPWKEEILGYSMQSVSLKKICAVFSSRIAKTVLESYTNAPSTATNKKLKEAAGRISDAINTITSHGILNLDFLQESTDLYQQTVLKHFKNDETRKRLLRYINLEDVQLIKEGKSFDVLQDHVGFVEIDHAIHEEMASSVPDTHSDGFAIRWYKIDTARRLWRTEVMKKGRSADHLRWCLEEFPTLFLNMLDMLEDPVSVKWKQKLSWDNNRMLRTFVCRFGEHRAHDIRKMAQDCRKILLDDVDEVLRRRFPSEMSDDDLTSASPLPSSSFV